MIRLVTLFPTSETSTVSSLCWHCLIVLVGCWGRVARFLVVLSLVLVPSLLVALTVLLLLRKLPLILMLVLVLTLMLMLVLVTLLELLRRVT
jgi:hypothetical protein